MILITALILPGQDRVPETPARSPIMERVGYLMSHQLEDGSWGAAPAGCSCRPSANADQGGDVETTAWVLLALAGMGFTELAEDDIRGRKAGVVIRSGLDWLVALQDKEGAFVRGDPTANALATLALTESYSMTLRRQEPVERAYRWVEASQPKNAIGIIRKGMVLQSGFLGEIGKEHPSQLLALASALDSIEGDIAKYGSLLLKGFGRVRGAEKPKIEFGKLDFAKSSPEMINVFAMASNILGDEDEWHAWFFSLRDTLTPSQRSEEKHCEMGSWDAGTLRERIRVTALRSLTLAHSRCFYCRNPFRKKK